MKIPFPGYGANFAFIYLLILLTVFDNILKRMSLLLQTIFSNTVHLADKMYNAMYKVDKKVMFRC